jgi:hypothetical protein
MIARSEVGVGVIAKRRRRYADAPRASYRGK